MDPKYTNESSLNLDLLQKFRLQISNGGRKTSTKVAQQFAIVHKWNESFIKVDVKELRSDSTQWKLSSKWIQL
jgi:hypothetical protein